MNGGQGKLTTPCHFIDLPERTMKQRLLTTLIATTLVGLSHTTSAENLLQVYQRAKTYDAQFQAQESAHLAALEKKQQALASAKPQVHLSGKAEVNRSDSTGTSLDNNVAAYTLQLEKSLFNRQQSATIAQADAATNQSKAALEAQRQDLIMRVANAYFAALTAQDNLNFAAAEKAAISRQLEQAKAYFEAGRSAITDVKEAEASYAASVAQEINAAQQLDVAREQLRVITGNLYTSLNAPRSNMPLTMPSPANMEAWVNTAKKNNHLLKASQYATTAAQKNLEANRAAKLPTVNLYANHTGSHLDNRNIESNTDTSAIGVSLSVPLYTGGALSSKVREAQHQLKKAQQESELQERMAEQQVRSAFLSVQSSISQVQANQQSLNAAETAAEATQAGFEVGTRTAVDVLNAVRAVFRARRDYAGARYSYLQNTLALRQAAGTLSENDVKAISALMTEKPKPLATTTDTADSGKNSTAITPDATQTPEDETSTSQKAAAPEARTTPETAPDQQDEGKYYIMPQLTK